jgi:aspartyl-tRNA(Asn)/glutamyl-tRNA(Gln) amidotransferase subunit C
MTDSIDLETFQHLVGLAALELDSDEAEYLRGELNSQLAAIRILAGIPLAEDVPASLHGVPYSAEVSQTPREDTWLPFGDPAGILAQAPETADGYIVVPDIPHTTLE